MTDRDRLKALLVERSVRLGEFTLASGARSSYYIDARVTTMSAEGQARIGKVAWEALDAHGLAPTHVGGLTMGADPVAYAIARESFTRATPVDGFSVRKEAKAHGMGLQIEGGLPREARCLVVEDSMTTGGSALRAIDAVRSHGAEVVGILTLVDREEGGAEAIAEHDLPLVALYSGPELLEAARASVEEA
ncbi:MAG: orotate phosphoribosyltransferase [Longimicrobiales bacterium]|nr:orotate phosphoribosyltransferase [Longimicrobiales bacterium]